MGISRQSNALSVSGRYLVFSVSQTDTGPDSKCRDVRHAPPEVGHGGERLPLLLRLLLPRPLPQAGAGAGQGEGEELQTGQGRSVRGDTRYSRYRWASELKV